MDGLIFVLSSLMTIECNLQHNQELKLINTVEMMDLMMDLDILNVDIF
jgi:hypothetical protein